DRRPGRAASGCGNPPPGPAPAAWRERLIRGRGSRGSAWATEPEHLRRAAPAAARGVHARAAGRLTRAIRDGPGSARCRVRHHQETLLLAESLVGVVVPDDVVRLVVWPRE